MSSIEVAVRGHRDALVGLAYRMLGTVTDAQDAVQEAFLRLERTGVAGIDNADGWLNRTTSRICLDRLTTARARREIYVGPWLPEPLATDGDPTDPGELAGDVAALLNPLAPDVVLTSDGGGKVCAARRPIHDADRVLRFLDGLAHLDAETGPPSSSCDQPWAPDKEQTWTTLHELANQVVAAQPFSQLLSGTLSSVDPDHPAHHRGPQPAARVRPWRCDQLPRRQLDRVRWGLALGNDALTSEYTISFLAPSNGTTLIARSQADSLGKRRAVCHTEVATTDGHRDQRSALAQGTVIAITRATSPSNNRGST